MKKLFKFIMIGSFLMACEKPAIENPQPTNKVDFSKLVAIGSSTTAGFMNGGLYRDGQMMAFPNLIAQQAEAKFEQALFVLGQENGTGFLTNTAGNTWINLNKTTDKTALKSTSPLLLTKYSGILNNLGIANLRMADVAKTGLGNQTKVDFNPFFERVLAAGKEDISYIDFLKETKPSFFLMNLGESDLMAFMASGGTKNMTETSVFALNCQKLLDAMPNTKGMIANLPNPIESPYLSFLTFEAISHTVGYHDGVYITTGNGIVRLATLDDYAILDKILEIGKATAGKQKGTKAFPVPNEEVLDKDEITNLQSRLIDYNGILKAEATKRNLAFVDLNAVFKQIKDKKYDAGNGVKVDYTLFGGNFFSLDGFYPAPRGQAIIANEFIKVLNTNYKDLLVKQLSLLDVSKYEGQKVK